MPDAIDAAVDGVQAARGEPAIDLVSADSGAQQLGTGDDAVLARGESGDRPVRTFRRLP